MFLKSLPKRLMSFFLLSSFVTNSLKFIYAQKISHQFINSFPLISLQFQKKHDPKLKNRNFESFQWNDINFNRRILERNEEGKPEGNIEKREREKKNFNFNLNLKIAHKHDLSCLTALFHWNPWKPGNQSITKFPFPRQNSTRIAVHIFPYILVVTSCEPQLLA